MIKYACTTMTNRRGMDNMQENKQDLMKLIQLKFPRLSKGQKLIAEYILKHYDKVCIYDSG